MNAVSVLVETDIFKDQVYVFTPGGDVIDLPLGATPVDFAYCVHTNGASPLRSPPPTPSWIIEKRPVVTSDGPPRPAPSQFCTAR